MISFFRYALRVLAPALAALALLTPPARSQIANADQSTLVQPEIACSSWKPTWESVPLPNGRAQPYIRVPLDRKSFSGNVLGPIFLDGQPPDIELFLRTADNTLHPLPISRRTDGPPPPAPASARIFWNEPLEGFPKDARMVVRLRVRVEALGPYARGRPNVQDEWLRYDLPGPIPVIDRSAMGPAQVSADANYVPHQEMLNGSQVAAFHASLRAGLPAISTGRPNDRIYLLSDNLISSRDQDESTRLRLGAGWVHSLPAHDQDIMPNVSYETWVQTNQAASNQGAGIALGRLIYGRPWHGRVGNSLYAALTPRFGLYPIQYTYLFRRDLRLDPGFTEKSFVDPSVEISLSPFFIGLKRGQTATVENHANLSLGLRGWWVSGLGPEYRYVARVQIPVRVWRLSTVGISYFRGADENGYFRYSNGVSFDFSLRH